MNTLECLGLVLLVIMVQGKLVDIRKDVCNIVTFHNNQRRDCHLKASDMLEMKWDDRLASRAETYSERCSYARPNSLEFDVGSNIYSERDFVHGVETIQRLINTSLEVWAMPKRTYRYGSNCMRACSYVQMITAPADRIGCALSTCNTLRIGKRQESFATLFVCFYSPRTNLMASLPYRVERRCSHCPVWTNCRKALCCEDTLTAYEIHQLTSAHNGIRTANNRALLTWDPYLERWARYVVNCDVQYPGPADTYTNFERLEKADDLYQKIYSWTLEGHVANIQLIQACRTPYDNTRCNHYTNSLQPTLTSMACAAQGCSDGTRQLVCIYDNQVDRQPRLRH